jgi:hypothetical protein
MGVCWDQRCCEVDGATRAGHTSCFRLSRDLTCPGPIACLLSDDGPGFVSDVLELAAYICYKGMLSSPKMTRVRMTVHSGRVLWNASLRKAFTLMTWSFWNGLRLFTPVWYCHVLTWEFLKWLQFIY